MESVVVSRSLLLHVYSARLSIASVHCARPLPTLPDRGEKGGKERRLLGDKQLAEVVLMTSVQEELLLLQLKRITQMLVILYAVPFRCIRLGKHKHTHTLTVLLGV